MEGGLAGRVISNVLVTDILLEEGAVMMGVIMRGCRAGGWDLDSLRPIFIVFLSVVRFIFPGMRGYLVSFKTNEI